MVTKSECTDGSTCTWRVHICHCTSISYMLFQQKVRLAITWTHSNSIRIICEIHSTIFYSFKILCIMMHFIEHSILPRHPRRSTQWTGWLWSFKLTPIMSILNKELKMSIRMNMYYNWSIVNNIMIKILQIFFVIT